MTAEPDQPGSQDRLKALLSQALALDAEEREVFVARAVEESSGVGNRLRDLVRAWDAATTMLRADNTSNTISPIGVTGMGDGKDLVGKQFDRYRIGEILGSGGFGVVYKAHQNTPVRRDVALKVVRPGVAGAEFMSRFEAERQALARLDHASIARIYDAGALPDGRPFFAMELVQGEPITAYCNRAGLPIDERVRLFIDVCRAVQHAHQKGVIHRDLKPSNILVGEGDDGAYVKIIDFGIARAVDEPLIADSVVTRAQQIIGTPQYMSPEQGMGDRDAIDTRSDVFSLGVVLYELLCGARPISDEVFRQTPPGDLGRVLSTMITSRPSARYDALGDQRGEIATRRATSPESLSKLLASELDWIVARAIDPEPDRRYVSPTTLAEDLQRYLADEAVEARPPSRSYLVRKFARRHKTVVVAIGTLAAALMVLLAGLVVGLIIVQAERRAAVVAQRDAEMTLNFFTEVFSAPRGDRQGRDVTVLDAVEAGLDRVDQRFGDRPRVAAFIHQAAGNLFNTMGQSDRAIAELEQAIELMREAGELDSPEGLAIRNDRAILHVDLGQPDQVILELEEAHRDAVRLLGAEHPTTLLIKANLGGQLFNSRGDTERAASLLRFVRARGPEANMEAYVTSLLALSQVEGDLGDEAAAEQALRDLLRVTDDEPGRWLRQRLGALNNLASRLHSAGRTEESLDIFRSLLSTIIDRFGPDNLNLITIYNNIASAEQALGMYENAFATRDEVEAFAARILPPGHPFSTRLKVYRGLLLHHVGRLDEAEALLLETWNAYGKLPEPPEPLLQENAESLASLYLVMGRESDAERWAESAGVTIEQLQAELDAKSDTESGDT